MDNNLNIFMHNTIRPRLFELKQELLEGLRPKLLAPPEQPTPSVGIVVYHAYHGFETSAINVYNNNTDRSEHSLAYDAAPSSSHCCSSREVPCRNLALLKKSWQRCGSAELHSWTHSVFRLWLSHPFSVALHSHIH